jgi:D-alanyl-D-alanine carboxypeptidase (penicillin-binding protein 5/6)
VPEFAYPQAHNLSGNLQKKPGTIKQVNHISILNSYPGADGLKTGYIDESGYNLAATALRDGTRYIAVILGVPAELGPRWGDRARTEDARKLFDYGFSNFRTLRVTLPPIRDAKIWKGRQNRLPVRPALLTDAGMAAAINNGAELSVTIPKERGDDVRIETTYIAGLCAPLAAGMKTGALVLSDSAGVLATISLLGQEDIQRAGAIKRFFHSLAMFFRGIKALPPVQNG